MNNSYDRPAAKQVISHHAGTVLEDGLESETVRIGVCLNRRGGAGMCAWFGMHVLYA